MKVQITQKTIKNYYGDYIYSVGYCDCWHLTRGIEPFAYNCGVYGWNCDYYEIENVCICTGYRPHGKSTHAKTKVFEEQAKKAYNNNNYKYETKLKKIATIRKNWVNALLEG